MIKIRSFFFNTTLLYIHILVFFIFLNGCNINHQNQKEIISKKGFIIHTDKYGWFFVDAKNIDAKNWLNDLKTENLNFGFQFDPLDQTKFPLSYIKKHLDSIKIKEVGKHEGQFYQMQLFPVEFDYLIEDKYKDIKPQFNFNISFNDNLVSFFWYSLPIDILDVRPLVKPKRPIIECKCERKLNDSNDYLYKICIYLKNKGEKFSDIPCNYSIRKIEADSLDSKKVTRVDLNCCYMGDAAYFDPNTEEIVLFSYGAR